MSNILYSLNSEILFSKSTVYTAEKKTQQITVKKCLLTTKCVPEKKPMTEMKNIHFGTQC